MWKEEVVHRGVTIEVIGSEYSPHFLAQGLTPESWRDQVEAEIERASLVIVEYFPVELERGVYKLPLLGNLAKKYAQSSNLQPFFSEIASICKEKQKKIAVADIANTLQYMVYDWGYKALPILNPAIGLPISFVGAIQELASVGHKSPSPTKTEKFLPAADDARRLLTALSIMQEAERWKEGSRIVYVAAPAHSSRVEKYIREGFDISDKVRLLLYKFMVGLDKSLRVYKVGKDGNWIQTSSIPVQT